MEPLSISAFTVTCAAGRGRTALFEALRTRRTGLRVNDFTETPLATWIGRVDGLESQPLPEALANWDCRNNRLAWQGLLTDGFIERVAQARERYGAVRIAVVVGTSTSSSGATEEGYRRLQPDDQYPPDLRRPIVHTPARVISIRCWGSGSI